MALVSDLPQGTSDVSLQVVVNWAAVKDDTYDQVIGWSCPMCARGYSFYEISPNGKELEWLMNMWCTKLIVV